MNKKRFSIFAILLVCVLVFAGCTKASNATLAQCYAIFDTVVTKYSKDNDGKIKVFGETDGDIYVDLSSSQSYGNALYNNISYVEEEGSATVLNTLNKNAEYQALIHGTTKLFLEWIVINPLGEIPQEKVSKLYEALDGLENYVSKVSGAKSSLEKTFALAKNNANADSVKSSLDEYLKRYCELINKFFNISVAYDDLYDSIYATDTKIEVTDLTTHGQDIKKLVLISEVYLAKYYYLRDIKLTNSYVTRFGFEKIKSGNDYINNPNYDTSFADFVEITKKDSKTVGITPGDADQITYYNTGVKKLESLKNGILNFEKAVDAVSKNNDKTGRNAKFIEEFEVEVQGYQKYLLDNIINLMFS